MIPPAASYQPAREELLFQELSEVRARLKEVERENSCLRKALAFKEAVIKAMEFLSGIRRCAAEKFMDEKLENAPTGAAQTILSFLFDFPIRGCTDGFMVRT